MPEEEVNLIQKRKGASTERLGYADDIIVHPAESPTAQPRSSPPPPKRAQYTAPADAGECVMTGRTEDIIANEETVRSIGIGIGMLAECTYQMGHPDDIC